MIGTISTPRVSLALAAFGLATCLATEPATAQQPTPGDQPAPAGQQQESQVQGQLVAVDAEAMSITVQTADGQSTELRYTDQTEVTGAQDSIAGLATAEKSNVTVHFTEEGGTRTATRIEVQAAQQ